MSVAYNTYLTNLNRARNFISLYKQTTEKHGSGRTDTLSTDILRAGVVFLHSTFEEYLRSVILERKIAMLSSDKSSFEKALSNVNLIGDNSGKSSAQKYYLKDFWSVKDQTVSEVMSSSLKDKVGDMTFNNYSQIVASLSEVGISLTTSFNKDGVIDNYIKRRHKIVHEADKNCTNSGRGNYKTASINALTLKSWIDAVDAMIKDIETCISSL